MLAEVLEARISSLFCFGANLMTLMAAASFVLNPSRVRLGIVKTTMHAVVYSTVCSALASIRGTLAQAAAAQLARTCGVSFACGVVQCSEAVIPGCCVLLLTSVVIAAVDRRQAARGAQA